MLSISLVLIDPNKLFRQGLRALLAGGDLEVVGEAATVSETAEMKARTVDLVLCDLNATGDIQDSIGALRRRFPSARVVVLSASPDPQALVMPFRAGVDGCLFKDISPEALIQSLRLVMTGEKVFPTQLAMVLVQGRGEAAALALGGGRKGLSPREREILRRLVAGESNKEIANRLGITEATIKVHLKGLLRKLGVSNRTQAAIWALNNGFTENGGG
ncbi:LuxR C-terminal-related transcriptional regulator [Arenibaculum pallidiluteum]|uniref:LuxR C-terminal-related transcriptional regulator n=1 Tax=Arenibaculum pallidiluteum TaxID=2812559 RepID=UPI001A96BC87|nr:response regulator transcription factor [Arenibaculum pallidiluteum]